VINRKNFELVKIRQRSAVDSQLDPCIEASRPKQTVIRYQTHVRCG